jgi:type IV secretory pathway VirB9-like protein
MRLRAAVLLLPLFAAACAGPQYRPPLPTLPSSASLPARPVRPPPPDTLPRLAPEDPVKASFAALSEGLVKPRREWFKGVTYMPPYHPNHSYLVYIPEGGVSTFQFSPGEKPQPATCADGGVILSQSWSSLGVGPSKSWVWSVKARMTAPRQDCTVTTNRGIYSVVIQPTTRTHTSRVRWSDPYGFLSEADPDTPELCARTDINYRLAGDEGAFGLRPGDVSNDGSHTCIRFPQSAGFDLPAVWLVEGDNERPASPAMIDGAYLIDGVPPVIELRTDAATLRIERAPP